MRLSVHCRAVAEAFAQQLALRARLAARLPGHHAVSLATAEQISCPIYLTKPARRLIVDDFLPASFPPDATRRLRLAARIALRNDPHSCRGRVFPPLVPGANDDLGEDGAVLAFAIVEYMRRFLSRKFGMPELQEPEALLQWLHTDDLAGEVADDLPTWAYAIPHIDAANRPSYAVSAILYLSTGGGLDFEGGRLLFHGDEADSAIVPREGRLMAFTSGVENPHSIERVTAGERFALSVWFKDSD
mmetsp:Transcript_5868/g.17061  ORF Transcript_5868/g.17061 Transcript_5868/m.17061 type:complete len:245 (-) Transcript_5868:272-1006(-)